MKFPQTIKYSALCAALLTGALVLPATSMAQTTLTGTMTVRISIAGSCTSTADDLNSLMDFFAQPTNIPAAVDSTSTAMTVNCTNGMPYQIGFGAGENHDNSTRRMKSGSDYVSYELYKESARTTVLGETWNTANTIAATGTGAVQQHVVYGRVPPQSGLSQGNYLDHVTVTLRY